MDARRYLTRVEMLEKNDLVTEDVYVDIWDGWVCVKSLTGLERDRFERSIIERKGSKVIVKDNVRAGLVAASVVDPKTLKPIFTEEDVEALNKKNAAALDVIFSVAQRLSKVSDEDVDELAKNSEITPGEGSISG